MKVAVTSVSGQLGEAIAKQLVKEIGKENVIGIARTPENVSTIGIEIRKGDYNNPQDFQLALKGVDKLLLVSGNDKPENRVQQHRNVIEAAKANGVRKIVYTSIVGDETKTEFGPVVKSNRQTEADIRESDLQWIIGRNGIYIEPDVEYIENYLKEGGIINSAGAGKCAYTCRPELAIAYSKLLLDDNLTSKVYNLAGKSITQEQLAESINAIYKTDLSYKAITTEAFEKDRKETLGDFMGTVIAGIYHGIYIGAYAIDSDFEDILGRPHKSPIEMIEAIKKEANKEDLA